jgi:rubrerythrin
MQPATGVKPGPISDVTFDLVTELSECADAVEALDIYIEDCKREGKGDVQQLFQQLRDDEMRHCDMIRDAIKNQVQKGKF